MEDLKLFLGLGYYLFAIIAGIKIARFMHIGASTKFKKDYSTYQRHFTKDRLPMINLVFKREYEQRLHASSESIKQAQIFYILLPILFILAPGILSSIYEADWIITISYIIYVIIVLFPFKILIK